VGMAPGVLKGGVLPLRKEVTGWFSRGNSQHARLSELERDVSNLKRSFDQVQQEWDATSTRVTKMLRRIRHEVQRLDEPDEPEVVEGERSLPLTTLGASGDRLSRIRQQLAAKGR